jgi:hypothetical protein
LAVPDFSGTFEPQRLRVGSWLAIWCPNEGSWRGEVLQDELWATLRHDGLAKALYYAHTNGEAQAAFLNLDASNPALWF